MIGDKFYWYRKHFFNILGCKYKNAKTHKKQFYTCVQFLLLYISIDVESKDWWQNSDFNT